MEIGWNVTISNNNFVFFGNVAGNVRDARMTVARRGGPCERTSSFAIAAAFRLAPSRSLATVVVRPRKYVAASIGS